MNAVACQLTDEIGYILQRGSERGGRPNLRPYVDADPDRVQVTRFFYFLVNRASGPDVDAEFVLAQAGGYIRMGLSEDVWVDAQGDPGPEPQLARSLGQQGYLRFTLHIEDQNIGSER